MMVFIEVNILQCNITHDLVHMCVYIYVYICMWVVYMIVNVLCVCAVHVYTHVMSQWEVYFSTLPTVFHSSSVH